MHYELIRTTFYDIVNLEKLLRSLLRALFLSGLSVSICRDIITVDDATQTLITVDQVVNVQNIKLKFVPTWGCISLP